jgi:gamma-glutamyltranspeptidase/glutathione hydrolase
MVVSSNPIASDVGLQILKEGGNAVDAAVAVGFALAVVYPSAGNIGGGGFMVIHNANDDSEMTIDFREKAPAAAHRDMYLDEKGEVVPDLSTVGYLACGVPGTAAGYHLAWERAGKLPWAKLIAPAVKLAQEGFEISYSLSRSLRKNSNLLSQFEESKRIFLRNGEYYSEGDLFRQPELARSLLRIAEEGPGAFYEGTIAELIEADMKAHGGLVTRADLSDYSATIRDPIRGSYRGHEVVSMGPPSSGGIVLVEMLNMLEGFPVSQLGFNSSEMIHLKAEVMRRAFADRAEFLGDPEFNDLPTDRLISKAYARCWAASIRPDWATPSSTIQAGQPQSYESEETTHFSVVDMDGNGVATTTTINRGYGSGVTIKGAGFLMNNEMDDFSSKPGHPNSYGLVQGEANAIAARKRPLSAMTPTVVKKEGKLFMVLGSPGGPTIINTVLQVLLNVVDFGMSIQEAVDAPRVHHQWKPDVIRAERDALARDVEKALRARGHQIEFRNSIGDAHSILIQPGDGIRLGAPDPRSDSKASGY